MAISERIINLLDGYSLLNKGRVAERLRQMTPESRQRVLNEIAAYYLALKPEAVLTDSQARPEEFAVIPEYGEVAPSGVRDIKQLALYADHITIPDPLVALNPEVSVSARMGLGADREGLDLRSLTGALERLADLKELILGGWVRLWPRELFVDDSVPIYYRALGGNLRSPELERYATEQLTVYPTRMNPDGSIQVIPTDELEPTRSIVVLFTADGPRGGTYPWFLGQVKVGENVIIDEASGEIATRMAPEDFAGAISAEEFALWVRDCQERTILGRVEHVFENLNAANVLNGHFVARAQGSWDVLRIEATNQLLRPDQAKISSALLQMDLPFLAHAQAGEIANLRRNEIAFEEFRRAIRNLVRSITSIPGTDDFAREVAELQADTIDPELRKLDQQAKRIGEKALIDGIIAAGSLLATAVTGQFEWLSGLMGAGGLAVGASRDARDMQQNSLYFLWKLKQ